MKKIGIITYHRSLNYGAVLQTYALQHTIEVLGYSAEIIDYQDSIKEKKTFMGKVKKNLWHKTVKLLIAGRQREKSTKTFKKKYLNITNITYKNNRQSLILNPPIYDIYIAGSDQIWNPYINQMDMNYLLGFVPKNKKKISYGSSFGISMLPKNAHDCYYENIIDIDYLSTREVEGKTIINELTGRTAKVVLDPTLLLTKDQWNNLANKTNYKDYILCYHMPGFPKIDKVINETALKLSKITGKKVIHIGNREYERLNPFKHSIVNAGPEDYLGLFRDASHVLTNSFHGTIFSIIYGKNFNTVIDDTIPPEKSRNSRLETILNKLDLTCRLIKVSKVDNLNIMKVKEDINNEKIQLKLDKLRKDSLDYLIKALSD